MSTAMDLLDSVIPRHYVDSMLGLMVRGFGRWRGRIALGSDAPAVPLILAGWRSAPDSARLRLAQELVARHAALRPAIATALFEHYAPYAEAIAAGEEPAPYRLPPLAGPDDVWSYVTPVRILIERVGGREFVEIAYRAAWDEEHTLGVRFQDWVLVALNGSVLT